MKKLILIGAAATGLMLAGCADEGYYPDRYAGGYSYYGPSDVWYDGYYGPYEDGYWDGDIFFFADRDGHFRRDDDGHFRTQSFEGAQRFRASPRRR